MKTGRSIRDILGGSSSFLHDHTVKNGWHCRLIRATISRGRITSLLVDPEFISLGAQLIQEGDIPGENVMRIFDETIPLLTSGEIHYYGQPIAILAADSQATLDMAEDMIQIDYEELPPLPDDLQDPQQIFRQVEKSFGDPRKTWEECDETLESSYILQTREENSQDSLGCIAQSTRNELRLTCPNIWPHLAAENICSVLKIDRDSIHIMPTNAGVFHDYLLIDGTLVAIYAALAAELTGKNMYFFLEEEERLLYGTKQPPIKLEHRIGFPKSRQTAVVDVRVDINVGAFALFTTEIINQVIAAAPGLYQCEAWRVRINLYRTNLPPMSIFRGFPATLLQIPAEIQANRTAEFLHENPLRWRRNNLLRTGDMLPPGWPLKERLDSTDVLGQLDGISDYSRKHAAFELLRKRRKEEDAYRGNPVQQKYRGIGMSYAFQPSGFSRPLEKQIKAKVRITLDTEGLVHAYVYSAPGTSAAKLLIREIIKEELGFEGKQVKLYTEDSRIVPDSGPVCLGRSLTIVSETFRQACRKLQKMRFHNPLPLTVESSYRLPLKPAWDQESLSGDPFLFRTHGALALELEIHPVTYIPEVSRIWMVIDAPAPHNQAQAQSAVKGGIIRSLDWVRGWPRYFVDGHFHSSVSNRSIRSESTRSPEIFVEFLPSDRKSASQINSFRDLPGALVPAAYLSALSQASGGYFDTVPSDSQMIYDYIRSAMETEDED